VRHLRAFVAVAEELNFSRAAERLYLSQPALSRQIRALERVVGCDLLHRSTRHVALTLAGEALLDRARPVLAALDEAVAAAQSVGGEMAARIMRMWAPVAAIASAVASTQQLRDVFEAFLAQLPMPPDLAVRAVNAGGVPGLAVGDDPEILYLHGGGYVIGSAYGYRPLVGALVTAAGCGAVVPDYRLAPEHPFPAAIDDSLAAYRWLVEQRGAADRVVLAGDSSAAGLVLAVLQQLRDAGEPMPAGAVLLCPGIDLTGERLVPSADRTHPMDDIAGAAAAYLAGHSVDDPLVSPLLADLHGLPPLLVQCASGDRARPEAEELAERAREHGVAVRLERYPIDAHVFHVFWSFLPAARTALAEAGTFIRDVLPRDLTRRGAALA
jgi:acetyl esterase/lipase